MILCTFNSVGQCVSVAQVADTDERTISLLTQDSNCFEIPEPKRMGAIYLDHGVVKDIPARPSPHHVFNYTTKQWEDTRTLADLKAAKWTQIKQARSQAEYAGFTWDGSIFDSDATSQQRITGAVALAQMSSDFTIGWVLQDNTVRNLNQTDMLQVGAALGQHVAAQFAKGVGLRAQIEAATTKEEVEAVVW